MHCDMKCSRCGKRYGWLGDPQDIPPCPICSYRPDPEAIQHDAEIIREFQDFLRARHNKTRSCMSSSNQQEGNNPCFP
jgi:hypothetical protein